MNSEDEKRGVYRAEGPLFDLTTVARALGPVLDNLEVRRNGKFVRADDLENLRSIDTYRYRVNGRIELGSMSNMDAMPSLTGAILGAFIEGLTNQEVQFTAAEFSKIIGEVGQLISKETEVLPKGDLLRNVLTACASAVSASMYNEEGERVKDSNLQYPIRTLLSTEFYQSPLPA